MPKEETRWNVKYGYKVFRKIGSGLYHEFPHDTSEVIPNVWREADTGTRIQIEEGVFYQFGFHVFTNKKDAFIWKDQENLVVKKVLVAEITSEGTQVWHSARNFRHHLKIVVCNRIKVLPDEIKR